MPNPFGIGILIYMKTTRYTEIAQNCNQTIAELSLAYMDETDAEVKAEILEEIKEAQAQLAAELA